MVLFYINLCMIVSQELNLSDVHQFELVSVCGLVCILLFILLCPLIIETHLILKLSRM